MEDMNPNKAHVEDEAASIEDMKRQVREYEERVGQPAPSLRQRPDGNLERDYGDAARAEAIAPGADTPREPRTIDGEVLPIAIDFGDGEGDGEATPDNALANAIAEHFGIEPSQITGFVAAVEHTGDEGITLSSVWSLGVPVWRLRAFARELGEHLKSV